MDAHQDPPPPIDRLPPEILMHIFQETLLPWQSLMPREHRVDWVVRCSNWETNFVLLYRITRVCGRWRALAINIPSFWSHIDDLIAARMNGFLDRSHPHVPLSLALSKPLPGPTDISLLQNLRQLEINFVGALTSFHAYYCRFSMPKLEVLSISKPHIDPEPLEYDTPSLKALAIQGVNPIWPKNGSFLNLTHLVLSDSWYDQETIFSPQHCRLLSALPALEALQLYEIELHDPEEYTPIDRPLSFPRLRSLWIGSSYLYDATLIVNALSLPAQCQVFIEADKTEDRDTLESLGPVRFSLAIGKNPKARTDFGIETESGMRIQVRCTSPSDGSDWDSILNLPCARILNASLDDWEMIPGLLKRAPRLTTIVLIDLPDEDDFPRIAYAEEMLASLPPASLPTTLETIIVRGADLFDATEPSLQQLRDAVPETVKLVIDPVTADHLDIAQYCNMPNTAITIGAGLCRWQSDESWAAERALQSRYWALDEEDGRCRFPWDS